MTHKATVIALCGSLIIVLLSHQTLAGGPALAKILEFTAGYVGGEVLDRLWKEEPTVRVNELTQRLEVLESTIASSNSSVKYEIQRLRSELDSKTSREAFEDALRNAMEGLQSESQTVLNKIESDGQAILSRINMEVSRIASRAASLESRLDESERRWKEYEANFGSVPRAAPKPYQVLLANESEAAIYAHPKLLDFVKLVSESEKSRVRLAYIQEQFQPNSDIVAQARLHDDQIREESYRFHSEINKEVEVVRAKEKMLLETVGESHFSISDLRRNMSSLLFLQVASKPVDHLGVMRLGVPRIFTQDDCSQVYGPYLESGGKSIDFLPLVEFQLEEVVFRQPLQIATDSIDCFPEGYEKHVRAINTDCKELVLDLQATCIVAKDTSSQLQSVGASRSPTSPEMSLLLAKKSQLLTAIEELSERSEEISKRALVGYCQFLGTLKPSTNEMRQLRERLVLPTMCCRQLTNCKSWQSESARDEVWERIIQIAPQIAVFSSQGRAAPDQLFGDLLNTTTRRDSDSAAKGLFYNSPIKSRDGAYRFSISKNGKRLSFFAGYGRVRESSTAPARNKDSVLFESLDFKSPIEYFDGGAPIGLVITVDGELHVLSSRRPKSWPKERDPLDIPSNIETLSGGVINPDNLEELKGKIIVYRGWEEIKRLKLHSSLDSVTAVNESFFVASEGERVQLFDYNGKSFGSIPVPHGVPPIFVSSNGSLINAMDSKGSVVATWELELFKRLGSVITNTSK